MLELISLRSEPKDHMRNKRSSPAYHLPPSLRATVTQQTVPHSPFFDGAFALSCSSSFFLPWCSSLHYVLSGIIFASLRDRLILLKDQFVFPFDSSSPHRFSRSARQPLPSHHLTSYSSLLSRYDLRTLLNDLVDAVNIHEGAGQLPSSLLSQDTHSSSLLFLFFFLFYFHLPKTRRHSPPGELGTLRTVRSQVLVRPSRPLPAPMELTFTLPMVFLPPGRYVIDAEVLGISNRWRKERGERELTVRRPSLPPPAPRRCFRPHRRSSFTFSSPPPFFFSQMRELVPDGQDIAAEGTLGVRTTA